MSEDLRLVTPADYAAQGAALANRPALGRPPVAVIAPRGNMALEIEPLVRHLTRNGCTVVLIGAHPLAAISPIDVVAALGTPCAWGNWSHSQSETFATKRVERFLVDFADRVGFYTALPGLPLACSGTHGALNTWKMRRGALMAVKIDDGANIDDAVAALLGVARQVRRCRWLLWLAFKTGLYRRTDGIRLLGMRAPGRRARRWLGRQLGAVSREVLVAIVAGVIVAAALALWRL
ncbi:MAG: hypothetical protein AB7O78_17960 [Thermoleophilia bacterium]